MVHLSKKQIIDLAKKLHIESLIVTGPNDFFGFAGARNAVMLLAPLLHVALQENLAFEEVLTLANSQLSKLFSQAVLSKEAPFIQMGDDDLLCDINLFFCDAYTAYANKETYFYRPGYLKGRITTECVATLDLQALLRQPQAYFTPLPWDDTPMQPAMPGMLSKPKLCLNVSFGHEESYVQLAVQKVMDFRRPALHLAGPRFYSKNIPKNRFSGLAATISAYIQYVFELVQIQELLDCTNVYNRSVLYWNSYKDTFTCLQDVIQTICQDAIFTKVQEQFWKNLKTYCERSLQHLDALIALPIEQTVRDFYKEAPWAKSFKKEIGKLKRVFLRLQQEALWYKLFAAHLLQDKNLKGAQQKVEEISQKPIGQHLFTQSLYVLCRVLGEGEFQKTLAYHQPM